MRYATATATAPATAPAPATATAQEAEAEKKEEAEIDKLAQKRRAVEERVSKLSAAEQRKQLERDRKRQMRKTSKVVKK